MFDAPLDLSKARVLLANDDGVNAPGLALLESEVRRFAGEVWVVAPESEQSGAGHSLTLRRPLRIRQLGETKFAVDGTPTDCVLLAVNKILQSKRPDLILSGVNRGANLGEDVTYSGTIAAAIEGTLFGIPSIALSQHVNDRNGDVHWETARAFVEQVVGQVTSVVWPRNTLMNVNFPAVQADAVSGIEVTVEGRRKIGDEIQKGVDPYGRDYYWIGSKRDEEAFRPGTDLECVYRGAISVTPLSIDLTDQATVSVLKRFIAT